MYHIFRHLNKKISTIKAELTKSRMAIFFAILLLGSLILFLLSENTRFNSPWSPVLYNSQGDLMAASLAPDGQFRFCPGDSVPSKLKTCIEIFEDKRFRNHLGVDFLALGRAIYQNITNRKVVSGASTITMQVVRMSKGNTNRTLAVKALEILQAIRLDLHLSKDSIMTLWATHAPFGGNVVGYEAASWRYFGRSADNLSWAEASMLAVLPNAPALILPGRNTQLLLEKRNKLLLRLTQQGIIDEATAELSMDEPIPQSSLPFADNGRFLLQSHEKLTGQKPTKKTNNTIIASVQETAMQIARSYSAIYKQSNIHNLAIIIVETKTGNVLAYVGNSCLPESDNHWVDVIPALRSPGSTLKPILYASMVGRGELLPRMLIADYPTNIDGYMPRNFDGNWNGALHADDALCRSVNVPFVRLLQRHGIAQFNETLKKMGITTLTKSPGHYGLSIILGGAETSLWEMTGMYASLGRILLNFSANSGRFNANDIHPPVLYPTLFPVNISSALDYPISPAGIWAAFDALQKPERPDIERGWEYFTTSRRVAWKTGTSFGFRDAWAIGADPLYTVGVWVGNANGVSASGLVGVSKAAPVLFDVFARLPRAEGWFPTPHDALKLKAVCRQSGFQAGDYCTDIDSAYYADIESTTGKCPYHIRVCLTQNRQYRTSPDCQINRTDTVWFSLSPIMEHYFRRRNPSYMPLPEPDPTCQSLSRSKSLQIIYPYPNSKVYIPRELDGSEGKIIFEAALNNPLSPVFWHIDGELTHTTTNEHKFPVHLSKGQHNLMVMDNEGNMDEIYFQVLEGGYGK
jgi:penicillin-binding protein 1C